MPVFHSSNMRQQFRCWCCVFRILHIPEEFKRLYHLISLALFVFLCVYVRALFLSILISVFCSSFVHWAMLAHTGSVSVKLVKRFCWHVEKFSMFVSPWRQYTDSKKGCELCSFVSVRSVCVFFLLVLACFKIYDLLFDWRAHPIRCFGCFQNKILNWIIYTKWYKWTVIRYDVGSHLVYSCRNRGTNPKLFGKKIRTKTVRLCVFHFIEYLLEAMAL